MAFVVAGRSPARSLQQKGSGDVLSELGPIFSQLSPQLEHILKDLNGKILLPLQDFAAKTAQEAKERQAYYSEAPQQALGLAILSPIRIVRFSVVALILAEVLDSLGVLENPQAAKQRIVKAFKQAKENVNVPNLQSKTKIWWKQARQEEGGLLRLSTWSSPSNLPKRMANWQPKHQFFVGATIGLLFSQFVWSVASQGLQLGVVVYALSELNELVKRQSGKSVTEQFGSNKLSTQVQDGLESVRSAVRKTAQNPLLIMETIPELIEQIVPEIPPGTKTGFLGGIAAGIVIV